MDYSAGQIWNHEFSKFTYNIQSAMKDHPGCSEIYDVPTKRAIYTYQLRNIHCINSGPTATRLFAAYLIYLSLAILTTNT